MVRYRVWSALAALLTAACNLTTAQPTPSVTLLPLNTPLAQPTALLQPAATQPSVTADPSGCTPRADWTSYTVQAGDTLSQIAENFGTTVDELIAANCLDDPDSIFTGQVLRVPGSATVSGYRLMIAPMLGVRHGWTRLQAGTTVRIQWTPATDEAQVAFYFIPSGDGALPALLGSDSTAGDGFFFDWVVPADASGCLTAAAVTFTGQLRPPPQPLVFTSKA